MFFIEARLEAGAELAWPDEHVERGVYVVEGELEWDGLSVQPDQMAVQTGPAAAPLRARSACRMMLIGGAPLDGERHLWWNFVASSRERIEQAKSDWAGRRFAVVPGDEDEYIPLPSR
jgi:redox-sensitive bicupin YhaK (pirin superfamily)